ncbi:MAG TPA: hypothetical protein VMH05_08920 [Bryobacteraceae bacterium]|nr:hypothetical protein [Bryobacteraceae bacterium]
MGGIAEAGVALRVVDQTKQLLEEAQGWSMWTWASETNKGRVRSGIESATAALEREVERTKKSWSVAWHQAYDGADVDPAMKRAVRKLKDAENEMNRATAQSKATFAEAERELSASKARQGAAEARRAIEIHETVLELARRLGS